MRARRLRVDISLTTILLVVLTGLSLWIMGQVAAIIVTVIIAFILVGTFNPAVRWLEERSWRRGWAVALLFSASALAALLFLALVIPAIGGEVADILLHLPRFQVSAAEMLGSHHVTQPLASAVKNFQIVKLASSVDVASTATLSLKLLSIVGYAATAFVLAIYFIVDHEKTRGGLFALVPRAYHVRLARILMNLEPIVGGYMRGQVLTSLLIGVFSFTLLYFCKVPHALALAGFAALTDVLPFVGGILATTPAVLATLTKGPVVSVIVLASMLAYQEFESRFIVPRVYGKTLRLSSAMVVIALLVGGELGGIMGALLALPLTAAIRTIVEELRVELPGDDTNNVAQRELDEKAERIYARKSAGTSAVDAGAVASEIVEKTFKTEIDDKK